MDSVDGVNDRTIAGGGRGEVSVNIGKGERDYLFDMKGKKDLGFPKRSRPVR